jgi:hypothetical protein
MKERNGEQLRRRHEAGEGRKPKVEPQGRKNDEDEVKQGPDEPQCLRRPHVVHVQNDAGAGQAGFDERAEIAPHPRDIEIALQLPGDEREHREFE